MSDKTKFFTRTLIFLLLLALLLVPLSRVMARKSLDQPWNMTSKISGFYNEPEDQFEVMFFGPSHAYAAFSPLEIWEETGIKSYVFATQQQPLWATYTYIREALKTQSPALIVVECRMAFGDKEYYAGRQDDGVTYSYMDDIPLSWNKVRLSAQSAPDLEGRLSCLFNFMKYHSRWNDLKKSDFTFDRARVRDPYKGFVMLPPGEKSFPRPDVEGIAAKTPLLGKNQFWLEEIIELCQDEGIELWLVKTPSNLEEKEKAMLNTVEATAVRYGVPFHDFNRDYADMGLDETLFYDAHHLDAVGAGKFSRFFAQILQTARPNLKTDPGDPEWMLDLREYQLALAEFEP